MALAVMWIVAPPARAEAPRGPNAAAMGARLGMRDVMTLEAREAPYPGPVAALAWSPDGARIASAAFGEGDHAGSSDVMLWDAATGRRVATAPRAAPLQFSLAFTPDSRLLVMAAARAPGAPMPREPKPDHLSLVDARTGAVVGAVPSGLPPPPPGGAPDGFAVAPAGGRAAAAFPGGQRGRIVVLYALSAATATGAPAASLALPWIGLRRMAFDPEGRRLALAGAVVNDPRVVPTLTTIVEVRDTRDGAPVWAARFDSAASFQSLAWGGVSGGTVALGLPGTGARGEMGDRVVALDSRTGARRWTARWPSASVDGLAFSPDGRLLAAASHGREMRLLDAATGETLLAVGGLRETRAVAWGPAGPRLLLAFNDGPRTRVIELTR